jgi:hypothetical protein
MTEFEEDNLARLMLKKKAEVMHKTVLRSVGRTKAGAIMNHFDKGQEIRCIVPGCGKIWRMGRTRFVRSNGVDSKGEVGSQ